jgi:probable phosphoglycerate mutase
MTESDAVPRGEPIAMYLRDLLLAGSPSTRVYLIRHAQSLGNRGEYDGPDDDPPLSHVGREQARRLAQRFRSQWLDAIYSSPLRRSLETAEAITAVTGLPVTTLGDLREVDVGQANESYDTYSDDQVRALADRVACDRKWDSFPGGEGSEQVRNRIAGAIDRIVSECPEQRVAVVCHAAIIMTYVSHILGLEPDFVFYPFNAGITSVRALGERRVIWRLNDIAHLDGMPAGFGGIS